MIHLSGNLVLRSRNAYIYCELIRLAVGPKSGRMKISMQGCGTLSKALLKSSRAAESSKMAMGTRLTLHTMHPHLCGTSCFSVNGKYYNVRMEI